MSGISTKFSQFLEMWYWARARARTIGLAHTFKLLKGLQIINNAYLSDTKFAAWNTKNVFLIIPDVKIVGTCTYNMQGAPKL